MSGLAASRRSSGPEDRFRRLFDDHFRIVTSYALRRTSGSDDAHDVTNETFAVAWRRLDDVPPDREAQVAWLLATARRVLANHHRSQRRRRALQLRVRNDGQRAPGRDVGDTTSEVERVRTALGELAEVDREILRLAAWEDLPHAQIAEILELSVSAVSVRLHRARTRLSEVLTGLDDDASGGAR
jgi:RNA polymerase sigma factor (sigma-70 family)